MAKSFVRLTTIAAASLLCLTLPFLASADSYDPERALDALFYCKALYCPYQNLANWSCPTCVKHHTKFTDISVFRNSSDAFLGATGYNPEKNNIVVAFRGTNNNLNWLLDFDLFFTDYDKCSGCKVHQGFFHAWHSIQEGMMESTARLVQMYPNADEILITGHSLGAAVSVLAAVDIAETFPNMTQYLYNFGDPRVGNKEFVQYFASTLQGGKQFRVTHSSDPVPHFPPQWLGYLHAPHELWYNNNGNTTWKSCNDTITREDPTCSDSVISKDRNALDHVMYLGHCTNCERQIQKNGMCPL